MPCCQDVNAYIVGNRPNILQVSHRTVTTMYVLYMYSIGYSALPNTKLDFVLASFVVTSSAARPQNTIVLKFRRRRTNTSPILQWWVKFYRHIRTSL